MTAKPNYRLLIAGSLLLFFGLLLGGIIPLFTNPRLALSAHNQGIIAGVFLLLHKIGGWEMGSKKKAGQPDRKETTRAVELQALTDSIQDEFAVIDSDYTVRWANAAVLNRLEGSSPVSGRPCYEVFYGNDRPCAEYQWDCPLEQVLKTGRMKTVIHPVDTLGTQTYLKLIVYPYNENESSPSSIIELRRDVTSESEFEDPC